MNNTELLAPAGNFACLHAGVRAGADAVYLGVGDFNARRNAENFTLADLPQVCDWAHVRGVRIYLTVNTAIMPSECREALELIRQAWRAGVDAFIVQDIGLATRMKQVLPEARLHISTQMNTHSEAGVEAAAQLAASRITLAREMNLCEIEHLCKVAARHGMEIETFVHGALCVCYSGQCLLSSLVGGRSANRGMCAQPCRLPYKLYNRAQGNPLNAPGEHLLSPKDLCAVDLIPELVLAGVTSFKIEGRMKSPEYVATVTGVYRAVLDRVLAQIATAKEKEEVLQVLPSLRATDREQKTLAKVFSRGFTQGYLQGIHGNELMSYGRPNNRGIFIGRVVQVAQGTVSIESKERLTEGDVLEFWTNRGHFSHVVSHVEMKEGLYRLSVDRKVGKGDRVFCVRSAKAAFIDDDQQPRATITGSIKLHIGAPAILRLSHTTDRGLLYTAQAEGVPVEAARTKAITAEEVRSHIDRFGTTPFMLSDLTIDLDEGVGMGFSQLHALRALAAERLQQAMLADYHNRTLTRTARAKTRVSSHCGGASRCQVMAWATNAACAQAANKAGADLIYVPVLACQCSEALVAGRLVATVEQAGYPNNSIFALPAVSHDALPGTREEIFAFDAFAHIKAGQHVYADSLAAVFRAQALGAYPEAGAHIPITNAYTVNALAKLGATRAWLSPELTLGQIRQISDAATIPLGLFVSGAAELMITEHCLLESQGSCAHNCTHCVRRKSLHYYKDRKDFELPIVTDCVGRSHLYNAVKLDLLHAAPDLIGAGISAFMVDTTLCDVEETFAVVARAVRARNLAERGAGAVEKSANTTTGHLFRAAQ